MTRVMASASALIALGMFGLIVVAGRYFELDRSSQPRCGVRRRLIDAAVVTCIGVLVPFALRYRLWRVVGATNARASLLELVELLLFAAGPMFSAGFAGESILGMQSAAPVPKTYDEKTTGPSSWATGGSSRTNRGQRCAGWLCDRSLTGASTRR
ncbi:MAG: hypothetical protein ACYCST_01085 [Acidimicrobiales bacterium]